MSIGESKLLRLFSGARVSLSMRLEDTWDAKQDLARVMKSGEDGVNGALGGLVWGSGGGGEDGRGGVNRRVGGVEDGRGGVDRSVGGVEWERGGAEARTAAKVKPLSWVSGRNYGKILLVIYN